ncbi:hypothetical protein TWF694_008297 [Orbilia ellipsospora]|uniref:Uncharacterized protein n=1 Tax=Orbilia ellipsospora TaxID=2528407 RepID=A0AAV9XG71_9PEZI
MRSILIILFAIAVSAVPMGNLATTNALDKQTLGKRDNPEPCQSNDDCLTETCNIAQGATEGTCEPAE